MEAIIAAALSAGIGAVASLVGNLIASGDRAKAQQVREQFAAHYGDQALPQLDTVVAQKVGPTALAGIQEDPALRQTQTNTMRKLSDLYESGGMSNGDQAALELANNGANARASSDYQSLAQGLAARGQQMNPALAAAMGAQASGTAVNAVANNRYQAQADARNRALQALEQSGNMAGGIRSQDYGVASAQANAQDRINQFNATQSTNAANQNNANQLSAYQAWLQMMGQQENAINGVATGYDNQAASDNSTASGIATAATSVGAGIGGYLNNGKTPAKKPGEP